MNGEHETGGSGAAAGTQPTVAPELLAQWRSAEDRLYPMVMVIPENYERVVRLVGATTVELQLACPDLTALIDEAPRVAERVRRLAHESGSGDNLEFPLIASAACLMRYRQIQAETSRDQRIRQIAAAADAGDSWVVLEQGAPPTTWPPLPSTTVEMHLPSGRALEMSITMDEATGAPRFGLTEVLRDPGTGQSRAGEVAEQVSEQVFADLHQWRGAIADRRHEIDSGH